MGKLLRKVAHPYLAKIDRLKIVTIMPSGHGSATCGSKYSSWKLESYDQRFCSPASLLKRLKGYEHLLDLCRDKGVYNRNLKHEAQGPKGAGSSEANFIARAKSSYWPSRGHPLGSPACSQAVVRAPVSLESKPYLSEAFVAAGVFVVVMVKRRSGGGAAGGSSSSSSSALQLACVSKCQPDSSACWDRKTMESQR